MFHTNWVQLGINWFELSASLIIIDIDLYHVQS
jgi:hypothetical protein